jgi:hypothetical protein
MTDIFYRRMAQTHQPYTAGDCVRFEIVASQPGERRRQTSHSPTLRDSDDLLFPHTRRHFRHASRVVHGSSFNVHRRGRPDQLRAAPFLSGRVPNPNHGKWNCTEPVTRNLNVFDSENSRYRRYDSRNRSDSGMTWGNKAAEIERRGGINR